jgi:hypothetical protein
MDPLHARGLFARVCPVVLACALVVLGALDARAQGKNLLANPGFEDKVPAHPWMVTAWDTSASGLETVFFGRDEFSAHSGTYGVSVASASAMFPFAYNWNQSILVTPDMWGKDAVLSVWTKSNGLEGRGYVLLQAFRDTVGKMSMVWNVDRIASENKLGMRGVNDPIIDLAWQRASFCEFETGWVKREVRAYVPPSVNMITVRCGLVGTGQLMLDDASLTLEPAALATVPPLNANLLGDPDFEGNHMPWEFSLPIYPSLRADRDSATVRSGKYSIRFSGTGGMVSGRTGVAQVFPNRALSGQRVRLTAQVRTDSLTSSVVDLKIFSHTMTGAVQESSTLPISGTTDWVNVIVETDVPKDTYEVWVWLMYMGPAPGRVYFDDASFTVLGPATGQPTPVQSLDLLKPPPAAKSTKPSKVASKSSSTKKPAGSKPASGKTP